MSLKPGEIDRSWKKVGMEIVKGKHITAKFKVEGKVILTTGRSHGSRMLDGTIPHKIRGQMKLNHQQFNDLIQCPLDRGKYIHILNELGLIPKD